MVGQILRLPSRRIIFRCKILFLLLASLSLLFRIYLEITPFDWKNPKKSRKESYLSSLSKSDGFITRWTLSSLWSEKFVYPLGLPKYLKSCV